ncbi:rho GTPase-activating protein REN1 isoform X3 [Castanea sativa]|uniref:rho GTPase-activating protein REN1 isoform X3 n=1 Tax=Castanea sativa TaxID=21020 RepID=UPI003F653B61
MTTRNAESSQGEGGGGCDDDPRPPPPPPQPEYLRYRGGNTVFKSGPLFISSKGIGWTSWKKRWFILTRTSLVFFRSDPNVVPQKGSEVNLTLGGIDLNNSGSVEVKADKKLLTVLFPDGRDGRAFTLKAETSEDLYEWKTALENALSQAPSSGIVMGQNGIFRNDQTDSVDNSSDQLKEGPPVKSSVIGRPVLLALEDVDGTPSFLEKALNFMEEYGVKVEGILRQAAYVEDVERRIREYEQGKIEFSPEEDPHIVADCVKYVLRELPSSPVPASCCKALLEACRTDRSVRVDAMRAAICETFPEPNRRLLQRVLVMMQIVASHKAENRMSSSAVAACMAPLLLRPLLAGDCEIETNFDVGGDGSAQLLQAAAAANHAQAIVITLLEEYDNIFGEGSISPEIYTDTEESGSESEEATDDDESYEDDEYGDATHESDAEAGDNVENASGETCSESGDPGDYDLCDDQDFDGSDLGSKSLEDIESAELLGNVSKESSSVPASTSPSPSSRIQKATTTSNGPVHGARRRTMWGRTSAKKNLSMESIDYGIEDEVEIQRLQATKTELENRIAEEAKGNADLQAGLETRKKALHERRLALEQDVARLQEQLQKERDLRSTLEGGIQISQWPLPVLATIDEKTKAELEEIAKAEEDVIKLKKKVDDLGVQLSQQREQNYGSMHASYNEPQQTLDQQAKLKDKQDTEATATSLYERSRSQDSYLDGAENESERLLESTSLSDQNLPQHQLHLDPASINSRSVGASANFSTPEPTLARSMPPSNSNSRRSGSRGEGANSTTSALSKLTTRLNFLKERRSQITNELQHMDKSQGSGRGLEPRHSRQPNLDKAKASEVQYVQSPDIGGELDYCALPPNLYKGVGAEGQSPENPERHRKSDSQSPRKADRGNRLEGQHPHKPDRGRSEGQGLERHSFLHPRTNSR